MNKIRSIFVEGKISIPYKIINLFCYYIIPAGIMGLLFWKYYYSGNIDHFGKELGERAVFFLLIILFLKPLSQLLGRLKIFKKILPLRKQLGVLMFWFMVGHAISMILPRGIDTIINGILQYGWNGYLFWGVGAGIMIFLLGVTSNIYSLKKLKKYWFYLHMLVYPAFFFTVFHIYLIKGEIQAFIIFGVYCVLKVLAWKGVKI